MLSQSFVIKSKQIDFLKNEFDSKNKFSIQHKGFKQTKYWPFNITKYYAKDHLKIWTPVNSLPKQYDINKPGEMGRYIQFL